MIYAYILSNLSVLFHDQERILWSNFADSSCCETEREIRDIKIWLFKVHIYRVVLYRIYPYYRFRLLIFVSDLVDLQHILILKVIIGEEIMPYAVNYIYIYIYSHVYIITNHIVLFFSTLTVNLVIHNLWRQNRKWWTSHQCPVCH